MKKLSNKIIIISLFIAVIVLLAVKLFDTYATGENQENDSYTFILTGDTSVNIPRYSYKDVIYQIKNTNNGTVNYGVGYTSNYSTTKVKVFEDSTDSSSGTITINDYKYVKLRIENYSDNQETVVLSTILGYENGGDLVVPSGTILVSDSTDGMYTVKPSVSSSYFYISTLTRENIESIEYKKLSDMSMNTMTFNIAINDDNSVRLWYELNDDTNLYKVYIGTLTGKVKMPSSMNQMFYGLTNVVNLNLSMFNTSDVTSMSQTFSGCTNLESVNLSSFDFGNINILTGSNSPFGNVSSSVEIVVANCNQVTEFKSKGLGLNNVHTINNDTCS